MSFRNSSFVFLAAALFGCGGPVETPVMVFDAGFGTPGADAEVRPDAAEDDAAIERDAGSVDVGFVDVGFPDGGVVDGGAVDGGFIDGGIDEDGGFVDGGAVDGGFVDGGFVDAGFPDAGFPDTGVFPDAAVDGGFPDTGVADAGIDDTGVFADADVPDQGFPDTGVFPDAAVDAGFPDTGAPDVGFPDTGVFPDAAVDAGPQDAAQPPPTAYTPRLIDGQFRHGQHVNVVDIDADGDLDVVASISLTDTVRLYVNGGDANGNGDGTTWSTVPVAPDFSIVAMGTAIADFDGDNDLDVAAIDFFDRNIGFNSAGDLRLYLQNPTGFTAVTVPVGNNYWGPRAIAAGDLTGDGLADVVTGAVEMYNMAGNVEGHGVRWHRNTGGNFTAATDIDALLRDVEAVEVVDVDGDGVADVVAAGRNSGAVVWYENNRTAGQVDNNPTFTRHVLASVFMPGHVTLGQLDEDPALEAVVIWDDSNGGALAWFDPPTNPRGAWTQNLVSGAIGGSGGVLRVAVGDVNDDGRSDIAVASQIAGQVRAFVRTGNGWASQLVRNLNGADAIATGDIDGDGDADLVGTSYENTPTADSVDWYQTTP